MPSTQVIIETSVTNNSPFQDSIHPDDHFQLRYVIPGSNHFLININCFQSINQSINRLMYPIAGINLNYRKGQRQQTYLALVFNRNKVIKTGCAA